jgi:hypothetical protein
MDNVVVGAISYNLYEKRKSNKTCGVMLISIAKGFVEKFTLLKISRPSKLPMMMNLGYYPPTPHSISTVLEKIKTDYFTEEEIRKFISKVQFDKKELIHGNTLKICTPISSTFIDIQCCIRLMKNNFTNIPAGILWCTLDPKGDEEYWLCPENMDFSNFIIGYLIENNILIKMKSMINYFIKSLDPIQGYFELEHVCTQSKVGYIQRTVYFAKQRCLKK